MYDNVPSKRASQTSSTVTLSALNKIAIFWAFFGSSTRVSCIDEGLTGFRGTSFWFGFGVLTTNNVSIISSFNLHSKPQVLSLTLQNHCKVQITSKKIYQSHKINHKMARKYTWKRMIWGDPRPFPYLNLPSLYPSAMASVLASVLFPHLHSLHF